MMAVIAGDKVALARAKIKDVDCRRCHAQKETLGHILGQCVYTKKARIERHDTIKDYILQQVIEKDKEAVVTETRPYARRKGMSSNPTW
jgi:hypothetical protein